MARYEPVDMSPKNLYIEQNVCVKDDMWIRFDFAKERISESSFIEWASIEERVVS